MPAVGDQHKHNGAIANPFEETPAQEKKQHVSEYTAQEIATLQSRLDKQLGPEYISSRPGAAGQKVHYLAAEKVINLANEIFGFNGWSSSIQNIQIDFVDEHPESRKITLGLSVIVRVTLKDGTYHEDIGYGHIENCKGKAAAFEKAKKEGTTDALKRALRTFGNVLGNCVYDKEYVAKVTKIKVGAGKWDEKNLHRHPDFVPRKQPETKPVNQTTNSNDSPNMEKDDSFIDIADFDDTEFDENEFGHPDEVVLPVDPQDTASKDLPNPQQQGNRSMQANINTPSRAFNSAPSGGQVTAMRPNIPNPSMPPQQLPSNTGVTGHVETGGPAHLDPPFNDREQSSSPGIPSQLFAQTGPLGQNGGQPARGGGFYSARAASTIDPDNTVSAAGAGAALRFNLHAESPSIRKTSGVDHNRSSRLLRDGLQPESNIPRKDYLDPQSDPSRKVGAPPVGQGGQSPGIRPLNTSAYRPPTRRGPDTNANTTSAGGAGGVDRVLTAAKRTPLGDLSNVQQQHNVTAKTDEGADIKRQKLTGSEGQMPLGNEDKAFGGVG